jgi:hypothetical protein
MQPDDESSDYGDNVNELHPHMSAPAVHQYLSNKGIDISDYTTFTITRHPIAMLWSYYNYFKPDKCSRYNYSPNYDPSSSASFADWLDNGKVGIGLWREYCPHYIKDLDFSPLSLEAHSHDDKNVNHIDKVFRLEQLDECNVWLQKVFGSTIEIKETNSSNSNTMSDVSDATRAKLMQQFPLESKMYDFNNVQYIDKME